MLYDLGFKGHLISASTTYFLIFAGVLGSFAVLCVLLAIAVRIGNLIIGW
jgi:hypothetical protein